MLCSRRIHYGLCVSVMQDSVMQDICTVAYHTCVQSIVTIVAQLTSSYNTYFKSSCYMASPLYNMSSQNCMPAFELLLLRAQQFNHYLIHIYMSMQHKQTYALFL